jgi:hypothetical protein
VVGIPRNDSKFSQHWHAIVNCILILDTPLIITLARRLLNFANQTMSNLSLVVCLFLLVILSSHHVNGVGKYLHRPKMSVEMAVGGINNQLLPFISTFDKFGYNLNLGFINDVQQLNNFEGVGREIMHDIIALNQLELDLNNNIINEISSLIVAGQLVINEINPVELIVDTLDTLKDATVSANPETFIALILAETIAGVIGGLSSRKVAEILNDKKKDGNLLKGFTTGAFFGSRSILRNFGRLLGLPRPIAIIVASLLSSAISEFVKFIGRIYQNSKNFRLKNDNTVLIDDKGDDESKSLTFNEISSDVSKWVIYDLLREFTVQQKIDITSPEIIKGLEYFAYGAFASFIASYVKNNNFNVAKPSNRVPSVVWKEVLEGGILFLFYEEFQKIFTSLNTIDSIKILQQKFLFDELIEEIEQQIERLEHP